MSLSFDVGFINYYLATFLGRNPLTYDSFGKYRPIFDTDCYTRGVLHMHMTTSGLQIETLSLI